MNGKKIVFNGGSQSVEVLDDGVGYTVFDSNGRVTAEVEMINVKPCDPLVKGSGVCWKKVLRGLDVELVVNGGLPSFIRNIKTHSSSHEHFIRVAKFKGAEDGLKFEAIDANGIKFKVETEIISHRTVQRQNRRLVERILKETMNTCGVLYPASIGS